MNVLFYVIQHMYQRSFHPASRLQSSRPNSVLSCISRRSKITLRAW